MSNEVEHYKQVLKNRNQDALYESEHTREPLEFYTRKIPNTDKTLVEMWVGDDMVDQIEFEMLNG